MSLKEVFASLGIESNKISWRNDLVQGLIIDRFFNTLTPVFEAVVLTPGHDPSSTDGSAPTGKNLWCRIRPVQTSDLMLPDPFKMKIAGHLRKVINQHPVAWLKQTPDGSLQPQVGEIWQCRYTTANKMGVEIIKKIRGSQRNYEVEEEELSITTAEMDYSDTTIGDLNENYLKNPAEAPIWPSPTFYYDGVQKGGNMYRASKVKFRTYTGNNTRWKGKKIYNGNIPPELLTTTYYKVDQNRSPWPKTVTVLTEALPFWKSFADAYQGYFGKPVPVNDSYRSYSGQVRTKDKHGGNAAYPGRSNHGWGLALDIQPYMKDPYRSMPKNGRSGTQPYTVPAERTSGTYKYPMPAGKAGTTDWDWWGAGFYSDFYIWANIDGNATSNKWINPSTLRNGKGSEEHWHYDFADRDKYISKSPPADTPGEDGSEE